MKYTTAASLLILMALPSLASANFYQQTDQFALKQGQSWSWTTLANTPKVKLLNKTPQKNPRNSEYYMGAKLGKYGGIAFYGTSKNKPEMITIDSSQTYSESEDGANVYKLHDLFRKSELTQIKSNCTEQPQYPQGEYQLFYKWQKKGYKPLYIASHRFVAGSFSGGIINTFVIAQDFGDFNKFAALSSDATLDLNLHEKCRIL